MKSTFAAHTAPTRTNPSQKRSHWRHALRWEQDTQRTSWGFSATANPTSPVVCTKHTHNHLLHQSHRFHAVPHRRAAPTPALPVTRASLPPDAATNAQRSERRALYSRQPGAVTPAQRRAPGPSPRTGARSPAPRNPLSHDARSFPALRSGVPVPSQKSGRSPAKSLITPSSPSSGPPP